MHRRNNSGGGQQGLALKVVGYLSNARQEHFIFRIGISGGAGGFVGENRWFYPALNTDIMFYRGGIGSAFPELRGWKGFELEWVISYSATFGAVNRFRSDSRLAPGIRSYPLYYFNNMTYPALQNPFNWSTSIAGNVVLFLMKKPKPAHQLVGFLNIHADRFQISYTNDGPPFYRPFGDRYDRYHTGGGFATFHGNVDWAVNLVELGFNKFTGYDDSSYELSEKIGSSYVFYHNTMENFYNKANWVLNVANTTKNLGFSIAPLNFRKLDVQHAIHESSHYPLHIVPYGGGWSLGPVGYAQYLKIAIEERQ